MRFNTREILHKFPDSGYRQIYPQKAPGSDPNLYEKISKRSHELYQIATGTITQKKLDEMEMLEKKRLRAQRRKEREEKKKAA